MTRDYQVCSACILDTTVPEIIFDDDGVCNYCKIHQEILKEYPAGEEGRKRLDTMVESIKEHGKGKKYDCVIGISGGTDSTYTLWLAKQLGLRPLAVHFDNGWNSEISVQNIKNATRILNVDLYTHVADWEEFKDLQIAFLKSSTPDAEVPTDYVIISVLLQVAAKEGIKYVIEGQASRAEGTTPLGWTYHDSRYLRAIQRRFGNKRSSSYPILSLPRLLYYFFVRRVKMVRPLEYLEYNKEMARETNARELEWIDPGGHHHESVFTKFFQSYYLTQKFGVDKRKRECSAKIRSGNMTREEGLAEVARPYPVEEGIVDYTISKLGLSQEEFEAIMRAPNRSFLDYPTYYPLIQLLRVPIRIACRLHIFPPIFYYKYGINYASLIRDYWHAYDANRS